MSNERKLVLLAVNPKAGSGGGAATLAELDRGLVAAGFQVVATSDLAELNRLAMRGSADQSLRTIVACGGDGTARLVVEQLGSKVPLSVFPLGTENLLAKHLGISRHVPTFCRMLQADRRIRLDVGRANGQLFLLMVSAGFDADVVRRLHLERRGPIRHWSYFGPMLQAIWGYPFPQIRIAVEGAEWAESRWAFVFNLPRYALNLPIMPWADGHDGWLDIKVFPGGNFWRGLLYFFSVLLRVDQRLGLSRCARGKSIELTSSAEVPYQVDGDLGGTLPLRVEILPDYLEVIVP